MILLEWWDVSASELVSDERVLLCLFSVSTCGVYFSMYTSFVRCLLHCVLRFLLIALNISKILFISSGM